MGTNNELFKRITARPDVFGGKPIVRDMRITVELIISLWWSWFLGQVKGQVKVESVGCQPARPCLK